VTRVSKFCFVAWLKRPLRLAWTHSSTPLSERFMISPRYRMEREAPGSPNADAQCFASYQTRISASACSGQNPMAISRYAVVRRHVSPRLLGLTAALRVRQSLVVDIVPGLTETVDTLTVSTLVAAIRAETAYSRQWPVDWPKIARVGSGGACADRPASPLGVTTEGRRLRVR